MTFRCYRRLLAAALVWTTVSIPIMAKSDAGAYLAARQAISNGHFDLAAGYYKRAMISDPTNLSLLENGILAMITNGDFQSAGIAADTMRSAGKTSELAIIAETVNWANNEKWDEILESLETGMSINNFIDGSLRAWATLGTGNMSVAIKSFDAMIEDSSLRTFGLYQKALALAYVGDFENAESLFVELDSIGIAINVRSMIARSQILSQLGRNNDAINIIDAVDPLGSDLALAHIRQTLAAGENLPYNFVKDPASGVAEAFLLISILLDDEASPTYGLVYARAAQALAPENSDATLRIATLLEEFGRFELAGEVYDLVDSHDPNFLGAELGRANALRRAGQQDAAIEVMEQLSRAYPDVSFVHGTLADYLRQDQQYQAAETAYTKALCLAPEEAQNRWFIYFTRGITRERQGKWQEAESDFRASLSLEPNRARVLNYLGYSLVERREKLEEALELIAQAVDIDPDNGAIVDSHGWVLYRLGRFKEATPILERAAVLEPIDPIINDHLGDAFWAVGRKTEARFQWQRALSFKPEEVDEIRIRRKLEVGLDIVLDEEGATNILTRENDNN